MVVVTLCCLKAAASQHNSSVLFVGTGLAPHTSPEAAMETGVSYKMAIGIMQNILQAVIKANKQKHHLEMLVETSQSPKNTSEKDPNIPF